MNGTLTYSPNNVVAEVGDVVQFQFMAGNHTVTQSTFDQPCQPVADFSNVTGFHSGFMPVAASASQNMIPIFSVMITSTKPIWAYCAQARHCESGMVMVINQNTTANSTRSLANYQAAASKVASTVIPGSNTTSGGTSGTTSSGSSTSTTAAAAGSALAVPSTLSLFGVIAALFLF